MLIINKTRKIVLVQTPNRSFRKNSKEKPTMMSWIYTQILFWAHPLAIKVPTCPDWHLKQTKTLHMIHPRKTKTNKRKNQMSFGLLRGSLGVHVQCPWAYAPFFNYTCTDKSKYAPLFDCARVHGLHHMECMYIECHKSLYLTI